MTQAIYVIQLKEGKFYVGSTLKTNLNERLRNHRNGNGSAWTKLHQFVNVLEVNITDDQWMEDNMVKQLMKKHGIENVRGGSYVGINLPSFQLKTLRKEIDSHDNVCWRCGRDNHYISNCYANTHIQGYALVGKKRCAEQDDRDVKRQKIISSTIEASNLVENLEDQTEYLSSMKKIIDKTKQTFNSTLLKNPQLATKLSEVIHNLDHSMQEFDDTIGDVLDKSN